MDTPAYSRQPASSLTMIVRFDNEAYLQKIS